MVKPTDVHLPRLSWWAEISLAQTIHPDAPSCNVMYSRISHRDRINNFHNFRTYTVESNQGEQNWCDVISR